jgi:TolB protein
MSYDGARPQVYLYDMAAGRQRLLVSQPNMTFAPRSHPTAGMSSSSMARQSATRHLPRACRRRHGRSG